MNYEENINKLKERFANLDFDTRKNNLMHIKEFFENKMKEFSLKIKEGDEFQKILYAANIWKMCKMDNNELSECIFSSYLNSLKNE